jgi:CheY-like chemotaxis protein
MKNLNVLLVEDNQINQIITNNFLRKNGLEVDIANHGKEALKMIDSKSYQFVLMDIQMPEMDGYQCANKIRSLNDDYFKRVPIFAFSSSSMVETMERAKQAGMTDFVNKPLMLQDLKRKVNKYVIKTQFVQPADIRPLAINFDQYTNGDAKSKWQLILLITGNILELVQSLHIAIDQSKPEIFDKIYHKVKPTLSLLADMELMTVIDELKNHGLSKDQQNMIVLFHNLCESIIKGLEEEQTTIIRRLPIK